jgi:hypothetical protein
MMHAALLRPDAGARGEAARAMITEKVLQLESGSGGDLRQHRGIVAATFCNIAQSYRTNLLQIGEKRTHKDASY